MKIKKNIALSDSGFIFNPSSGDSFSTNPIGVEILKMLKEGQTTEEISKSILNAYQVDETTIEKDLYDFFKMIEKYKLTDQDEQKKN